MVSNERKAHLQKLQSVSLTPILQEESTDAIASTSHTCASQKNVSDQMDVSSKLRLTLLKCLEGILIKAKQLLSMKGALAFAPGQSLEARMVLSYSGKPPHMVTPKKNGDFSCDGSCPNWKSLGICSHSVAGSGRNKWKASRISLS